MVMMLVLLAGARRDVTNHSLVRLRQLTHHAFERLDQDPPLRLRPQDAQRIELGFQGWWNPEADLRIVTHLLAWMSTRWRTARAPSLLNTSPHSSQPSRSRNDLVPYLYIRIQA